MDRLVLKRSVPCDEPSPCGHHQRSRQKRMQRGEQQPGGMNENRQRDGRPFDRTTSEPHAYCSLTQSSVLSVGSRSAPQRRPSRNAQPPLTQQQIYTIPVGIGISRGASAVRSRANSHPASAMRETNYLCRSRGNTHPTSGASLSFQCDEAFEAPGMRRHEPFRHHRQTHRQPIVQTKHRRVTQPWRLSGARARQQASSSVC